MSNSTHGSPLLGPLEYAVGMLAPAEFLELNAGAGSTTDSSSRLSMNVGAARNLQQRFMNEVQGASGSDERDWLRTWRKKIREPITRFNDAFFDFLIKDREGKDQESIAKMKHLITRISNNIPTSGRSYFPELGWDISMNTIKSELEEDLDVHLDEFKESHKKLLRVYSETLKDLFTVDARLQDKIGKMNQVVDKVQAFMQLEANSELDAMAEPTANYLAAVLKNNDISSDFVHFMIKYKQWTALYDTIQLSQVAAPNGAPTCCICTVADITHAMIPCGHTFCSGCINKQMSLCYLCRTSVRDRLKLHFP
jgi:hypothetical protein